MDTPSHDTEVYRRWIFALVVILLMASVFVTLALLSVANQRNPYPKVVSATNSTLHLVFFLSLNATLIHTGQAINITGYDVSSNRNLSVSGDWAKDYLIGGGSVGICRYLANAVVFHGYYSDANLSSFFEGNSSYILHLYKPLPFHVGCTSPVYVDPYPFQRGQTRVGFRITASGYHPPSGKPNVPPGAGFFPFVNFEPGTYTIVAGDCWGQLVIDHFEVVS